MVLRVKVGVRGQGMHYVNLGPHKYRKTSTCVCVRVCVPSGEVMVEESGVPVQDDWSMAPDEDRVRFSLSGVTPLYKTTSAAVREELTTPQRTHTHKYTHIPPVGPRRVCGDRPPIHCKTSHPPPREAPRNSGKAT